MITDGVFLGFLGQFFDSLQANTWFGLAIFVLLPLIMNTSLVSIVQNKAVCHINNYVLIIVVSLCCSVPLLFFENGYGLANAGSKEYGLKDFQCWIKDSNNHHRLFLYGPVTVYCSISLILIFYIIKQWIQTKELSWVSKQCVIYLLLCMFPWIFLCINRIYLLFGDNDSYPFILIAFAWIALNSRGITTYIVWKCFTFKAVNEGYNRDIKYSEMVDHEFILSPDVQISYDVQ